MLGTAPEISETLQWMLQSRQVGDELLVNTLVHEQYSHICRFVSFIISSQDIARCECIAGQVIYAAVEDAASYQGKLRVQAWLFKYVVTETRRLNESLWNDEQLSRRRLTRIGGKKLARNNLKWTELSPSEMVISIALFYLFDFSHNEIAAVIDVQESSVAESLKQLNKYYLLPEYESGGHNPARVNVQKILSDDWPSVILDKRTADQVSQRVLNRLQTKDKRKHRAVIFGEAILAILAIFLVAGMGDLISRFTPEPTPEIIYETRMVNQIVHITQTPGPTHPPTPFPDNAIIYQAAGGETLAEIADKISQSSLILTALNNITADESLAAGRKIMIGVSESRVIIPTPISPDSTILSPQPPPEALTLSSNEAEIHERLLSAREYWQTLWADALVVQYGPPGYMGEPDFRRQQIWIDQPYFNYVLDGENGAGVDLIYSTIGGWETLFNTQTGEQFSNVGPQELNYQSRLHKLLVKNELHEDYPRKIDLLALEMIAGREALVIDWYADLSSLRGGGYGYEAEYEYIGRFWVDTQLGIVLRAQNYSGRSGHLVEEIIVSKIKTNIPIPRRLYNRSQYMQTYFAQDHTGNYVLEPIEIPDYIGSMPQSEGDILYLAPPLDLDLSNSHLEIYWTDLSRFNAGMGTRVEIFADGYHISNVEFSEPEQLLCERSANGELIAFTSRSIETDFGSSPLGWFNLNKLPEVHHLNPEIAPYDFSFSPDSQQLAVYGCQRDGDQACGIYIIELLTGESRLLNPVEQGAGLVWKPDGSAIAIQGSFLKHGKWRLLVFDSDSGMVMHDGTFDWEGIWISPDSPIHDWGVQYPPMRGGLELCTLPPRAD